MVFPAQVVRVLIASPNDVMEERERIERAIHRWNADHAESTGTVLLPVRWEANATAEMGGRPQAIINRQLVDSSDALIGVFWTRLGTPTGVAESGTAEEIQRAIDAGKHVSLYFSDRPAFLTKVDLDQFASLREFRDQQQRAGLVQGFETPDELERYIASMLVRMVREKFGVGPQAGALSVPGAPQAAVRLRIVKTGLSDYLMVVENFGAGEAQDVGVAWDGGPEPQGWDLIEADAPIDFLPNGTSIEYMVLTDMGSPRRANYRATWRNEDGTVGQSRQTLSL